MPWLSNVGKLLLMASGFVALLDLAGPAGVAGWAKRAEDQQKETSDSCNKLNTARKDQKRVKRTAAWAASAPPPARPGRKISRPEPSVLEDLPVEEFLAFRREAWVEIEADRRYNGASLRSPQYIFPFFEEKAYKFFIERLVGEQRAALDYAFEEFKKRRRRWEWMRLALLGSVLPGSAVLAWWFHTGGIPWVASIIAAYLAVGSVALTGTAALLTPRIVTALLRSAATIRLGLARAAVKAMGDEDDGRPLRKIALGIFIAGSLLDLLGGW